MDWVLFWSRFYSYSQINVQSSFPCSGYHRNRPRRVELLGRSEGGIFWRTKEGGVPLCKETLLGFWHIIPVNPREYCRSGCLLDTALPWCLHITAGCSEQLQKRPQDVADCFNTSHELETQDLFCESCYLKQSALPKNICCIWWSLVDSVLYGSYQCNKKKHLVSSSAWRLTTDNDLPGSSLEFFFSHCFRSIKFFFQLIRF